MVIYLHYILSVVKMCLIYSIKIIVKSVYLHIFTIVYFYFSVYMYVSIEYLKELLIYMLYYENVINYIIYIVSILEDLTLNTMYNNGIYYTYDII